MLGHVPGSMGTKYRNHAAQNVAIHLGAARLAVTSADQSCQTLACLDHDLDLLGEGWDAAFNSER